MKDAPVRPRRGRRHPAPPPSADRDDPLERVIRAEELAFGKSERGLEEPLPATS